MRSPPHSCIDARGDLCDFFDKFFDGEDGGHSVEPRENSRFEAGFDHEVNCSAGCGYCCCFILLSCYDIYITSDRNWQHIGEVNNNIIEIWVSTSNTCTAAGRPLRQIVGTQRSTSEVETGIVPSDRYAGPLSGKYQLVSLTVSFI